MAAGQSDFVCINPSSVDLSDANEKPVLEYEAPANTPMDCVLQSFSHGTPADSSQEKIVWRIYTGLNACSGSSDISSTGIKALGRGTTGSTGTLKTGGTLPTLGNPAFRESVNQQAGYTNPQVIGIAGGTRILVTAQQLGGTDTVKCFGRLVMRNPAYA